MLRYELCLLKDVICCYGMPSCMKFGCRTNNIHAFVIEALPNVEDATKKGKERSPDPFADNCSANCSTQAVTPNHFLCLPQLHFLDSDLLFLLIHDPITSRCASTSSKRDHPLLASTGIPSAPHIHLVSQRPICRLL